MKKSEQYFLECVYGTLQIKGIVAVLLAFASGITALASLMIVLDVAYKPFLLCLISGGICIASAWCAKNYSKKMDDVEKELGIKRD